MLPTPSLRVRHLVVLLLVLALPPLARQAGAAAAAFRERPVALLPYGAKPEQMSAARCEGADSCSAFAFTDSAGTFYVFDLPANTLRIVSGALEGHGVVRAVPGPVRPPGGARPHDGCVGRDGTVYLLVDRGTRTARYRVHARGPAAATWTVSAPLDDREAGWPGPVGDRVPDPRATRIACGSDGAVTVSDPRAGAAPGIVVASGGRLLPPAKRSRRAAGAAPGIASGGALALPPGRALGVDAFGTSYQVTRAKSGEWLERYDSAGRLLGSCPLPRRRDERKLVGKGGWFVPARGGVLEARFTGAGLALSWWEPVD